MQLVDDHAAQAGEELRGVGIGQQQRQRFRRGHQEVGRPLALAQAAALRRVAGAALGPHRQAHLGDRRLEVAADVGRQRLQRRDVERVQLALALLVGEVAAGEAPLGELDQGRQEARQGLAAAGRRDQQRALALAGPARPARAGAAAAPSRGSRTSVKTGREDLYLAGRMHQLQWHRHPRPSLLALSDAARPLLRARATSTSIRRWPCRAP